MKRQLILCAFGILLFVPFCPAAGNPAEIVVKRDNTTILTLRLSDRTLAFFTELPSQFTTVLRERGVDYSSQTRISATEWKCCHGKFLIISTDSRVQEMLTAAFTGPKVVQR
jgi:hypothetical protein